MASLVELLRGVVGGLAPDPLSLDPGERHWALSTGMAPLLCSAIDESPHPPVGPATELWPELEGACLAARVRSDLLRSTLAEVLGALDPLLGQRPVLLKGAATAEELYSQPYLRPMRDLDLLLSADDADAAEDALRSLGYRQQSANVLDYYADHHHSMPFFDAGRDVWVEIHRDLFPARDPLAGSKAFARTTWREELSDAAFEGHSVRRFTPEYQLLHAACHWSEQLEPMASLPALVDMSLLLRRHAETLDWDRIFDWLEDPLVSARAVPVLAYLEADGLADLSSTPATARLRRQVRALGRASVSLQHWLIRRFCIRGISPGRFLTANNRDVLWAALNQPGGGRSRLAACAWQLAFPPTVPRPYSLKFQLSRLRSALRSQSTAHQ